MIMGTENLPQWHEWKAVMERPFIPGTFLWTGIDYLGESNDRWPINTTRSGLLDRAGFKKPGWHMYRTLWSDDAHVYLATQTEEESRFKLAEDGDSVVEKEPGSWKQLTWFWSPLNEHWNYAPSEMIIVEAISNCESLELFLNNESMGTKSLADFEDRIYKWAVPFEPGTLVVKGRHSGRSVSAELITAGEPAAISLAVDRRKIQADGTDACHVVAQLVDAEGTPVPTEDRQLTFSIEGEARLLGVDTGAPDNVQDFQSNTILTDRGRCLAILQAGDDPGRITIKARAEGLESKPVRIRMK
jgi:hypothetical protein